MRLAGLVLAVFVLAGPATRAQAPPAAPAPAPAPGALDNYLLRWEQEMLKVQTLSAEIVQVRKDKAFNTQTKLAGWAAYMKDGTGPTALNLAAMELSPVGKKEFQEKYVCTGSFIYQFVPAQKEVKVYELPRPRPGQVADEGFLAFMFGMRAQEARRRYELKLAREDRFYVYVDVTPRQANDKADFQRARLVLSKDTFLPRQLWFEAANGDEVLWDIPRSAAGVRLDRRLFDKPQAPAGWRVTTMQRTEDPQPRVIRTAP
jgi:TIGR03009 family protein